MKNTIKERLLKLKTQIFDLLYVFDSEKFDDCKEMLENEVERLLKQANVYFGRNTKVTCVYNRLNLYPTFYLDRICIENKVKVNGINLLEVIETELYN